MGLIGIIFIAVLGTAITMGIRTGSLAPYYPAVSRSRTPYKFWTIMVACGAVVALNVANLIRGQ